MNALLDVEKSLNDACWALKDADEGLVRDIARQNGLSFAVARLLAVRGLSPDTVPVFLQPSFKALLPEPYLLKDMEAAAKRLAAAVTAHEKIAVFGDYDVDGETSSAVMKRYLNAVCDNDVTVRIPERDDGYGPTASAMEKFVEQGAKLIVTVDCGTTAFDAFAAVENKADVIVVDHHEPDASLPKVYAVVNPKRLDEPEDNPCRTMAAVGVVFLLVVALNRLLRQQGWFSADRPEPDIRFLLDLVALGTVCDVMKLQGVNRLYVKAGLAYLAGRHNKGLAVLSELAGVKGEPDSFQIGFYLGPRLNACGRIGRADLAFRLLCARDEREARDIAETLNTLNDQRRDMCAHALKQALEEIEKRPEEKPYIFIRGEAWHTGIVGIIAGRLKDRYKLPALVMTNDKDDPDMLHGSGRSVSGVNLGEAVIAAVEQGILERGGGHAMAAGFSVRRDNVQKFDEFFGKYLETHAEPEKLFDRTVCADALLDTNAVTPDFLAELKTMEPFGEGNPPPRFVLPNVAVTSVRVLKNGNISCLLKTNGAGRAVRAIAFKAVDTGLGVALMQNKGELMHFLGTVREDFYSGRGQGQFIIEDAAMAV